MTEISFFSTLDYERQEFARKVADLTEIRQQLNERLSAPEYKRIHDYVIPHMTKDIAHAQEMTKLFSQAAEAAKNQTQSLRVLLVEIRNALQQKCQPLTSTQVSLYESLNLFILLRSKNL